MLKDKRITGIIIALIAVLMMILGYILFSRSLEQRFGRGVISAGVKTAPAGFFEPGVPAGRLLYSSETDTASRRP